MAESDQRKFPRTGFREPVQYRSLDKDIFIGSAGYDLSEGGVRFATEDFIPLNSEVMINLQFKPEREAKLAARVVWIQKVPHSDNYHVGCEFLGNRDNIFPRTVVKNLLELYYC